jgi:coproporphyrinogen III oxidase-like Fe-S oxidoreductase
MLALRLSEGLSLIKYEGIFGISFLRGRERILDKYEKLGLLEVTKASVRLTEKGFYLSNTIISELV